ncbi:EAL domain-containing protein [Pseudomarimonas arenosa]|uniref:cyclic-guanylate-specific phosphodiesterase n=1 Tax=Pseudomarimonas arenosa TaxID=2774145 RepID=A0AAW3ZQY8_9GAMM|nr:EAL domain-containing protein [Pseudomarimonas arenosa]MBD8527492.1 EAL domain-containing protein [Pseudomarimonas arenosa]
MLVALCTVCGLVGPAQAVRRDYFFESISSQQGLAQNTVHAMLRDGQGFVWVATQGGLHRYDGYQFELFQHDPNDQTSLPASFVTALALGEQDVLWIGFNAHFLARLDLRTRKITRLDHAAVDDPQRNQVSSIRVADDGQIWLGTGAGIERVDPLSGQRTEVVRLLNQARIDRAGMPRSSALEFDAQGFLWAATDGGLFRIDRRSGSYQAVGGDTPAFTLHRDAQQRLWVARLDGLFRVNETASLEPQLRPDGQPFEPIYRLSGDQSGRLWMAPVQGGLLRYQPDSATLDRIDYVPGLPAGLPEQAVASLMVDPSGLLWVGGESTGISTSPADGARFTLMLDLDRRFDLRGSNNIRVLLQIDQRHVWVGAERQGLKRLDLHTGQFENFIEAINQARPPAAQGRGIRVLGLSRAEGSQIWVSTDQGLYLLDPEQGRAQWRLIPADPQGRPFGEVLRYSLRSRDGSLWFGSYASGVARLLPSGEWRFYQQGDGESGGLSHNLINHIYQDRRGQIWVSTLSGLNRIDPDSDRITQFDYDANRPDSVIGTLVRGVEEASDGRLWVATHSGVAVTSDDLAADQLRFERLSTGDGLVSNTIYAVLEARDGAIWASSNLGLMRIDPATRAVRAFGLRGGLQDLEFNGGAQLRLDDGRLLFGGIKGLNLFDPSRVGESVFDAPLAFTQLSASRLQSTLRPLVPIERWVVAQDERVFRFRFAALDYTSPQRNRFQYLLEGFDNGWSMPSNEPTAVYTNLDAGSYRLRVRASNFDGHVSAHELGLELRVEPVWWASNVAKLIYLLSTIGIVLAVLRARQRRRQQELTMMRELRAREERLKLALWGSGDEFWDWDIPNNSLIRIGADQLLGLPEQHSLSTDEWRERAVHPDDLPRVQSILQAHIAGETPAFESEHRIRNAKGQWIWVRSRGKLVERDRDGRPLRMAGTARDVTQTREAEGERRIASEVLRSMGEAVGVTDLQFHFVSINPAFTRITGYELDEVEGRSASLLDSEQQQPEFYSRLRASAERTGKWKGELWQRRKDGVEFLAWLELAEVRDARGQRTHYVVVLSDVTEKRRAEQELRYLASYDTLTGLPNRTLLSERLARAVVRARRNHTKIGVLFIDLDRFKDVNDSLGHAAGDRLLKSAAVRLLSTVRESDTVARLGGDEFTVVLEDLSDRSAAEHMAARIIQTFAEPLDLESRGEVIISPSIGIALFPEHGQVPADLLKFADTAMYAAKDKGRNNWQVYDESLDADTRRRMVMLSSLRKAIERNELSLMFQPKLSLRSNQVTGVEALLRWHSAELGPVPPASFIPLAEETGLILPLGEWVLQEAARTLARWRQQGHLDLVMAVNVSMAQFLRGHLERQIEQVIRDTDLPPQRLELEVTESMVMANAEQAIRVLRQLRRMGVKLAIDDFGTGYSSLVYLKRLPIDTLKIDKEFVGDLTRDPDDEAITATVINMAHTLDLKVVAEGVESEEQLTFLRHHGCDEIQGYWLARPLSEVDCLEFLRQHASGLTALAR